MIVNIESATANPIEVISKAAGTCYGKHDVSCKRLRSCYNAGHMSVFEHASVTFYVEGISRACSHQLVRHRLASFCQESQRYCKINVDNDDWYVMPAWFELSGGVYDAFKAYMLDCAMRYKAALEYGARPEDARYLLPEATKTAITVTMNCRELFHFLDMRQSKAAQWEICDLANEIEAQLLELPQWREIMLLRIAGTVKA